MKIVEKNGVKYCVFNSFEDTGAVSHCFSTRVGGISEGVYSSLNVSYSRGDKKENVDENIRRLAQAVGFNSENIVDGLQVHGVEILDVGYEHIGEKLSGYDGYITNKPDITLCTYHADCVPLFFLDKTKNVIALSHSGWRGTAAKMAYLTVKKMESLYGCDPRDIIAGIGPSIGPCCFQVDSPVVEEFKRSIDFSEDFIKNDPDCEGKYKIDLWGINEKLITLAGVPKENIEVAKQCTMCGGELFFSHRRMGNDRGSMAAYLSLKK